MEIEKYTNKIANIFYLYYMFYNSYVLYIV